MKRNSRNIEMVLARKDAGLTQEELAKIVGRSRYWINRVENNLEKPSEGLADEIAKAIGKRVEDVFPKKETTPE